MPMPRKIRDAKELRRQISAFIDLCQAQDLIPSDYEFRKFLGVSTSTLDRWRRGGEVGETYHGFDTALKDLTEYREHRLLQRLENEPRLVTATIFELKQAKNGGYTDGPVASGDGGTTITLKIAGVGGEEAFK